MLPERLLLNILLILAVTLLFWFGFTENIPALMVLPIAMPIVIFFITRVETMYAVLMMLYGTMLTFPGAPANFNLFTLMCAAFTATVILRTSIVKSRASKSPLDGWVWAFLGWMIVIIAIRGVGIRALGSDLWGGAGYVNLFFAITVYLSSRHIVLSPKLWRRTIYIMCFGCLLPFFAQIIYTFSGGKIYQQYLFIQPLGFVSTSVASEVYGAEVVERFQAGLAFLIMMVPLIMFRRYDARALIISMMIWLPTLAIIMLSGYRSHLGYALFIPLIYLFIGTKRIDFLRPTFILLGALFVLLLMAQFAYLFPLSVQRTLSAIPGANVAFEAKIAAAGTIDWRLQVWKMALDKIPDYLFIGEGLAFDPNLLPQRIVFSTDIITQALVARTYHNGPISLILILGLPGFIIGIGYILVSIWWGYRQIRRPWKNELLQRIFLALYAYYVQIGIGFIVAYGDVQISFPQMFLLAAMLHGVRRSDHAYVPKEEAPAPAPTASRPTFPIRAVHPGHTPSADIKPAPQPL